MRYSVWSWNDQVYHVFDGPGDQPGRRPTPRKVVNGANDHGYQPEALTPILPRNAVQVGQSDKPQGRVAIHYSSPATGLGEYVDPSESPLVHSPWMTLGIGALGVYVSYALLTAIARRF